MGAAGQLRIRRTIECLFLCPSGKSQCNNLSGRSGSRDTGGFPAKKTDRRRPGEYAAETNKNQRINWIQAETGDTQDFLNCRRQRFGPPTFIAPRATVAAEEGNIEQQLMTLDQSWCNTAVKNDAAAVSAILADDVTDVSVTGKLNNKAQDIANLKTDKTTVCDEDKMKVRVYGDAAVVVGRATATFNGQFMFTDTYIRRNGHWQVVASQSTEIKQ